MAEGRAVDDDVLYGSTSRTWQGLTEVPVLVNRLSRRRMTRTGWKGIHLRKTVREWVKTGRLSLQYIRKPVYRKPGKLVVLWDVSGSMATYIPHYLPWLERLARLSPDVGVFPFGTRLVDITETLKAPSGLARRALSQIGGLWVGGTSIGSSLQGFNAKYASRWIGPRTTVIIISDGWEVGDPSIIGDALRDMKRRDATIYWMNPLMATPGFEPRTRALLTARPFLERMMSGHDARALKSLALR